MGIPPIDGWSWIQASNKQGTLCSKMAHFNDKWITRSCGFAFSASESIFKPSDFQSSPGFILSYAFLSESESPAQYLTPYWNLTDTFVFKGHLVIEIITNISRKHIPMHCECEVGKTFSQISELSLKTNNNQFILKI